MAKMKNGKEVNPRLAGDRTSSEWVEKISELEGKIEKQNLAVKAAAAKVAEERKTLKTLEAELDNAENMRDCAFWREEHFPEEEDSLKQG